jgi:hypothetical protein
LCLWPGASQAARRAGERATDPIRPLPSILGGAPRRREAISAIAGRGWSRPLVAGADHDRTAVTTVFVVIGKITGALQDEPAVEDARRRILKEKLERARRQLQTPSTS